MAAIARFPKGLVTNLRDPFVENGPRRSYSSKNGHARKHLRLVSDQPKPQDDLIRNIIASLSDACKAPADRRRLIKRLVVEAGFKDLLAEERRAPADLDRGRLKAILVEGPDFSAQPPARWHDRTDRGETPPNFIKREYAPWLGQGLMQSHIRRHDRELYQALASWQQRMGKLPPEFGLPTKKDMTDNLLAQDAPFDEATLVAASRWQDRMRTRRRRADTQDRTF